MTAYFSSCLGNGKSIGPAKTSASYPQRSCFGNQSEKGLG